MAKGLRTPQIVALFAGAVFLLAAFGYWAAHRTADPLCAELAGTLGADCRADMPLEAQLTPGALVDSRGAAVGRLDDASCLLPGAPAVTLPLRRTLLKTTQQRFAYSALEGDGVRAIPGPAALFSEVGRWQAVKDASVQIDGLHETSIDAKLLPRAVNACLLQVDCAQRIGSGEVRVQGSSYVADQVTYSFSDAGGKAVVAPSTLLTALPHAYGNAGARYALSGTRLVGTRYLGADATAQLASCSAPVTLLHGGLSRVEVSGSGQRGALAPSTMTRPLGSLALVSSRGTEVSDCDPNLGRQQSHAYAQAQLDANRDGSLHMAGEIRASSGRYRYGRCMVNGHRLPSNNTLANAAKATLLIEGELAVAVRTTGTHKLTIEWSEVPAGTQIRIVGPAGRELQGAQSVATRGTLSFDITGPGIYRVLPRIDAEIARSGESGVKSMSFDSHVVATVDAPPAASE